MRAYPITLACLAVLSCLLVVTIALLFDNGQRPESSQAHWIYGPRQTLQTAQPGVIVYCQGKTNSRAFAEHKHATPGDVVVETCRAVVAP